jgi:peptidylprolyl isomerase
VTGGVRKSDVTASRALPVLLLVAALTTAAACSSSGSTPAEGDSGVSVSADTAAAAEITVPDGEPPSDLVVETVVAGDGDEVEAGDLLLADYSGVLWDTGEEFDSSWSRGEPAAFGIGTGAVIEGWDEGLVGQTIGSRVLLVIPPELAYGDEDTPAIPGGSTLVFVVDVRDAFSAADAAQGPAVTDLPDGLPQVSGAAGEQPQISVDGAETPAQSDSVLLVEGGGDPLDADGTLVVHAVQSSLTSGEVLFSTWDGAPVPLDAAGLPGLAEALDGADAGARALTRISAEDNAGEPLVLVVDVLASY